MVLHDERLQLPEPNESDGEESSSLSFSDLPMAGPDASDGRPSTPPESDPFEFFFHHPCSPSPAEMCAAADVFHGGKLLPFAAPRPPRPQISKTHVPNSVSVDHRRLEAGDDLGRSRRFWAVGGLTAEYRKLRRVSSESKRRDPLPAPARPRPRWYQFAFGSVRVPAAMEMSDIRSRQRRRSPPSTVTAEPGGWVAGDGIRGPWKLLRSLSCKGVEAPLSSVS